MKRLIPSLFFFFLFFTKSYSQNWANDIAPILYNNCTKCHNPNGAAPFSLIGFSNAYANKDMIHMMTMTRMMPPWPPDPNYRHLAYERVLSQKDIDAIMNWVIAGAPSGDTTKAPPAPVYSSTSSIPNPDLTSQIPTYTVQTANGGDMYRCFVIPSGLLTQKYITQIEVMPGNRNAVHHILVFEDTTSKPAQLDAADPLPGYTSFGGTGSNASKLIGAWVPGQGPMTLPAGMGILLHKNTNIVLQVHYPYWAAGMVDSSVVRFRLSSASLRNVAIDPLLNHYQLDNGPLVIAANTTQTFNAHFNVPAIPYSILAVGPHMHLIGKSIKVWAVTTVYDTIPLINIPDWDFMWQGSYNFQRIQKIPANAALYSSAFYDNTIYNPNNPNNPPKLVTVGEATTDEMMLVYFTYTPYLNGDENILLDSTLTGADNFEFKDLIKTPQLYDPYPNPASGKITTEYFLPENSQVFVRILDLKGSAVKILPEASHFAGINRMEISLEGLASGQYILQLLSGDVTREKKFVIQ